MISPKEYFPDKYLQDFNCYATNSNSYNGEPHLCGRVIDAFIRSGEYENLHDGKSFFICQYELNLLNQVIHASFPVDHAAWRALVPVFADCRCTYGTHPLEILKYSERRKGDQKIVYTRDEILQWDEFFLNYMRELCDSQAFKSLTLKSLINAIKNDADCNNAYVKSFFMHRK